MDGKVICEKREPVWALYVITVTGKHGQVCRYKVHGDRSHGKSKSETSEKHPFKTEEEEL